MPRSNDYPRRRFVMMQITMWIILLASVGVAALVSRVSGGVREVMLGAPVALKTLSVQLPKGWRIEAGDDGDASLAAIERVRPPYGRTIEVVVDRPGFFQTLVSGGGKESLGSKIDFGDVRGGATTYVKRPRLRGTTNPDYAEVLAPVYINAHGVGADGWHIEIKLFTTTRDDEPRAEDEALVERIAASVRRIPPDDGPQLRAK